MLRRNLLVAKVSKQVSAIAEWIIHLWASFWFGEFKHLFISDWSVDFEYSRISWLIIFPNRLSPWSSDRGVHLKFTLHHSGCMTKIHFLFRWTSVNAASGTFLLGITCSLLNIKWLKLWVSGLLSGSYMIITHWIVHFRNLELFFTIKWWQVLTDLSELWLKQNWVSDVLLDVLVLIADQNGDIILFNG